MRFFRINQEPQIVSADTPEEAAVYFFNRKGITVPEVGEIEFSVYEF